jgi:hypothetical protein
MIRLFVKEEVVTVVNGNVLFSSLPSETWLNIMSFIDKASLYFFSMTTRVIYDVIAHNHAHLSLPEDFGRKSLINEVVKYGYLEYFLIFQKNWEFSLTLANRVNLTRRAAKYGHFVMLKHIILDVVSFGAYRKDDTYVCAFAALSGDLPMLKWLREVIQCPWDDATLIYASCGGHFEILKYAIENKCPWSALLCATTAEYGHFEILKWLKEVGCPWDSLTCHAAAKSGRLDILKWARKQGCDWSKSVYSFAAMNNDIVMLKWLKKHECPIESHVSVFAAKKGHLSTLIWLKDNGFVLLSEAINSTIIDNHLEVFKWLIENIRDYDVTFMTTAIGHNRFEMVVFIYETGKY